MDISGNRIQQLASRFPCFLQSLVCWLMLSGFLLPAERTLAKEYALVVGGGTSQWNNPVSLERQVQRAIQVLATHKLARIDVLFADGTNPEPDLLDEFREREDRKTEELSPREKSLLRLYGHQQFALRGHLRNHEVPNVSGPATKANLEAWFKTQGSQLEAGDKLLLYFATHGAPGSSEMLEQASQCELLLWNGGRVGVKELGTLLEQLPAKVEVQLLITACYGGGFAELGWPDQGVVEKAKTSHLVSGFFATAADRPASGCTSDSEYPAGRPYGDCFWSALAGMWPDGEKVAGLINLNSNGEISFGEAHGFAMVNDKTINTPLKTSDYALRLISRVGRVEEEGLLTDDPYYDELRAAASREHQQLLDQLSTLASLTGQRRLSHARTGLRRLESDLRTLAEERSELAAQVEQRRVELLDAFNATFPALARISKVPEEALVTIRQVLEMYEEKDDEPLDTKHNRYNIAVLRLSKYDQDRHGLEKTWAKYQRFVQTAESVILAHNLPLVVKDKAVLERFAALKEAENGP